MNSLPLVENIETAMFTTKRKDPLLVSTPVATQVRQLAAAIRQHVEELVEASRTQQ